MLIDNLVQIFKDKGIPVDNYNTILENKINYTKDPRSKLYVKKYRKKARI